MNAFTLGRMRHIELLEIWHRLNPDSHLHQHRQIAALSKENLISQILATT